MDHALAHPPLPSTGCPCPAAQVREFEVIDAAPYAVEFRWDKDGEPASQLLFEKNSPFPSAKMLTFLRAAPFSVSAHTVTPEGGGKLGEYTVSGAAVGKQCFHQWRYGDVWRYEYGVSPTNHKPQIILFLEKTCPRGLRPRTATRRGAVRHDDPAEPGKSSGRGAFSGKRVSGGRGTRKTVLVVFG